MKSISIVFPVHNEEGTLELLVSDWAKELTYNKIDYEFVIVEDGSLDNSKKIIKDLEKKFPIVNLSQNIKRGYSQAVVDGIKNASKEYILCTDSDGQIKVKSLIENLKNLPKKKEFLIGYRNPRKDPLNRLIYSKIFKIFYDFLFNSNLKDPSCPFVIGLKSEYELLPHNNLLITREAFWWGFVAIAKKKGLVFIEKPIEHFQREHGEAGYKLKDLLGIIYRNCKAMIEIKKIKNNL